MSDRKAKGVKEGREKETTKIETKKEANDFRNLRVEAGTVADGEKEARQLVQ